MYFNAWRPNADPIVLVMPGLQNSHSGAVPLLFVDQNFITVLKEIDEQINMISVIGSFNQYCYL